MDHAPALVDGLALSEANLESAIAQNDDLIDSAMWTASTAAELHDGFTDAAASAEGMEETAGSTQDTLGTAAVDGQELVAQLGELSSGFDGLGSALGDLGGLASQAGDAQSQQLRAPTSGSLLDRARDWLVQQAMSQFMDAAGNVSGAAGPAAAEMQGGQNESDQAVSHVGAMESEQSAELAETTASAAEAGASQGRAAAAREQFQGEADSATEWQGRAESDVEERLSRRDDMLALLAEVRAERARQESDNAAFASRWGDWFAESESQSVDAAQAPVPEELVDGLWSAYDELEADGDALVQEAASLSGALSADARQAAERASEHFADAHAERIALVFRSVSAAASCAGSGDPASWQAVEAADAALRGGQDELRAAWSTVLPLLLGLADLEEEEERVVAAQPQADTPPPA